MHALLPTGVLFSLLTCNPVQSGRCPLSNASAVTQEDGQILY